MKKNIITALLSLSCFLLQAQRGIGTPNPDPSAILELKSATKGFLPPRLTKVQRDAIVFPLNGLVIYNTTSNCLEWYEGTAWYSGCGSQDSSGGTAIVSGYSCSTASVGTLIEGTPVSGVTQTITTTVVRGGTYSISAVANGVTFGAVGTFTTTGAQNIVLTASGTPLAVGNYNFVLNATPNCNFDRLITSAPAYATCDGSVITTVVPVTSTTGRIWMDRNLGASRSATSSSDYKAYGCLYQWGRENDGHASITWTGKSAGTAVNATTATLSAIDSPGNALFIMSKSAPFDWRSSQNDALWQGLNGKNNPCPSFYRVPTVNEINIEFSRNNIKDTATAYSSDLKFMASGYRDSSNGAITSSGSVGMYWSSTINSTAASTRYIDANQTSSDRGNRAYGFSVRCIKD